ncbi:MAG: hypothetical protein M1840_000556 [Geoglossum simile]|nr:MAG: hypothetical protein M1840_000556 [Geoglossum simile]
MILNRRAKVAVLVSIVLGVWTTKRFATKMRDALDRGGIIGCCSAYYLTRHPSFDPNKDFITVLEATEVAGGSSGKAGGMLAAYADPQCLAPLSFRLHADLASEHGGENRWGHRNVPCGEFQAVGQDPDKQRDSHSLESGPRTRAVDYPAELDWVIPDSIKSYHQVGNRTNTAQLHPYLFTTTMAKLAEERGARIILGAVLSIDYADGGKAVRSVTYREKSTSRVRLIPATDVLIAAGPWTSLIFPQAPIVGARSHSIVIHPSRTLSGFALWPDIIPGLSGRPKKPISPEIYSRPDGTVYACGPTDYDVPLPPTSDKVAVRNQSCADIFDAVGSISKELNDGQVLINQACYRPVIVINGEHRRVGPLLGKTGIDGLLIASGHDSWGIQNSPATGKIVSELIFDGEAKSADIRSLDPKHLMGEAARTLEPQRE